MDGITRRRGHAQWAALCGGWSRVETVQLFRRKPHPLNYSRRSLEPGRLTGGLGVYALPPVKDSYLVDSASSHMLVSKIKPCMSKYKQLYGETANGSLNQLSFI